MHAAGFELGQHLHPELRTLGVLKPEAEDLAVTIQGDRHRQVTRAALTTDPTVADLQHERVEEHDGVDVLQRPGLPRPRVLHDGVGDLC